MNIRDYALLVEAMRQAQKDFFVNHSNRALQQAKRLEQQVDAATLTIVNSQLYQQGFSLEEGVKL